MSLSQGDGALFFPIPRLRFERLLDRRAVSGSISDAPTRAEKLKHDIRMSPDKQEFYMNKVQFNKRLISKSQETAEKCLKCAKVPRVPKVGTSEQNSGE
jgi:hypothetical protein